ncbi:MAG: hypothetical protein FWG75_06515 [Cystobacterineae bacterium]|nr:hypothetical protein [Cystobacterineae bacterium]
MNPKTTVENKHDKETDVKKLQDTVESMDNLSQDGFSEIEAIAMLAEQWLESPDSHKHLNIVSTALRAIWGKAQDIQNCINSEAENVGCHYVPEDRERRWLERKVREALQE